MPIWKLTPTTSGTGSDSWRMSTWFSAALIRADTAERARKVAARAFRKKAGSRPRMDESMMISPWMNESLVACRRVPGTGYPAEGEEQILEPLESGSRKD
jgi:hypothetical protein